METEYGCLPVRFVCKNGHIVYAPRLAVGLFDGDACTAVCATPTVLFKSRFRTYIYILQNVPPLYNASREASREAPREAIREGSDGSCVCHATTLYLTAPVSSQRMPHISGTYKKSTKN